MIRFLMLTLTLGFVFSKTYSQSYAINEKDKFYNLKTSILNLYKNFCIVAIGEGQYNSALTFEWLTTLIFRFENIVEEFKQYGLNDLVRTLVCSAKIVLSTLLVLGIWFPSPVLIPALLIGFLMISTQCFLFKVKNSWKKTFLHCFFWICVFSSLLNL